MRRAIAFCDISNDICAMGTPIDSNYLVKLSLVPLAAYIIDHSEAYTIAALGSWVEFWVEYYIFGSLKFRFHCVCGGLLLIFAGQVKCEIKGLINDSLRFRCIVK